MTAFLTPNMTYLMKKFFPTLQYHFYILPPIFKSWIRPYLYSFSLRVLKRHVRGHLSDSQEVPDGRETVWFRGHEGSARSDRSARLRVTPLRQTDPRHETLTSSPPGKHLFICSFFFH